jgi:uncharacterized protein DUF5343
MALPTAYLTSTKNADAILEAIKKAQVPPRFTQKFLEGLGFSSIADRLYINVLKSLGFLNEKGEPTQRYYEYLDETQSERVLAEGIREAYADLFQLNANAQDMSAPDLKNKMKTLSQGQLSDSVLSKMVLTFKALAKNADFGPPSKSLVRTQDQGAGREEVMALRPEVPRQNGGQLQLGGLVYSIQIHLPETRDPAVYDALFRSLKEHLLK